MPTLSAAPFQPFFLDDGTGAALFGLYHPPAQGMAVRGAVLHLAAMGEELNRSRKACAAAARAMAKAGFAVLQLDLTACGDSAGQLAAVDWATWVSDATKGVRWLQSKHPEAPVWLWGHRTGALLATALLQQDAGLQRLLLWHPTLHGDDTLRHWLRLKAAGSLTSGDSAEVARTARADWQAGRTVHVAGYELGPGLAAGLSAAAMLPPPARPLGQLLWLDVSPRSQGLPLPASQRALSDWQAAGWQTTGLGVADPQFWQSAETECAPALVQATVEGLLEAAQA